MNSETPTNDHDEPTDDNVFLTALIAVGSALALLIATVVAAIRFTY